MGKIIDKCEHCCAKLEYEEGAKEVTCEYCNCKKILNNGIIDDTKTNSIIDNDFINTELKTEEVSTDVKTEEVKEEKEETKEEEKTVEEKEEPTASKKPKKKRKKNTKKRLLYFFFTLVIIASGIIYYLDSQRKEDTPEIYEPLPSEIAVKDADKTGTQIESSIIKLAPDVDLNAERVKYNNNDIIGRLEVPDLFNVLVVKGKDNSYYLNHSVKKAQDVRGTEFIDYRLTPNSQQINIYGHNSRDSRIKVAFIKLEKLLDKTFFDNNQYIIFQHDGGKKAYKIIAIKEIYESNNEHMGVNYIGNAFIEHVQKMTTGDGVRNSRELYYNENSEILVLQTCSHHWNNALYIITAVKVQDL